MSPSLTTEEDIVRLIDAKRLEREAAWSAACDQDKRVKKLQKEAGDVIAQHHHNFGEQKSLEAVAHSKDAELLQLELLLENSRRKRWSDFGLPLELLVRILSFLDPLDLVTAGLVSLDWHAAELAAWRGAGERDFRNVLLPPAGGGDDGPGGAFGDGFQDGADRGFFRDEYRRFKAARWGPGAFEDLSNAGGLELQQWRGPGPTCQLTFKATRHAQPHHPLPYPPPGRATSAWKRLNPTRTQNRYRYNALAARFIVANVDVASAGSEFVKMLLPTNRGGNTFVGVALLSEPWAEGGSGSEEGSPRRASPERAAAASKVWVGFCPSGGQVACGHITRQGRFVLQSSLHRKVLHEMAEDVDNSAVGILLSRGRLAFVTSPDASVVDSLGREGGDPAALLAAGRVSCTGWVLEGIQGGVAPMMALCDTNDSAAPMAPESPEVTERLVAWVDEHSATVGAESRAAWLLPGQMGAGRGAAGAGGAPPLGAAAVAMEMPHVAPVSRLVDEVHRDHRDAHRRRELARQGPPVPPAPPALPPPHAAVP